MINKRTNNSNTCYAVVTLKNLNADSGYVKMRVNDNVFPLHNFISRYDFPVIYVGEW